MPSQVDSVDTPQLAKLISALFDLSTTSGIKKQIKDDAGVAARRLRGHMVSLLSARFEENTKDLLKANKAISDLNEGLAKDQITLASYAEMLDKATKLIAGLDKLIGLAAKFL